MTLSEPGGAALWIANTVSDLIQGDVREHLPLDKIPLQGDVLGLGTTTSLDNGELIFRDQPDGHTSIWKGQAGDGGIRKLRPGDGSSHFPYVCFSSDATHLRRTVDLTLLGATEGRRIDELVAEAITGLRANGQLPAAPVYGLRLLTRWHSLIITVASKLCVGQQRRNALLARSATSQSAATQSIYQQLQHFRLSAEDPGDRNNPIRYLAPSLQWECCGFWDSEPSTGRLTVPLPDAHLHLHGCSTDLRHGGHLVHEHADTVLQQLERLVVTPIERVIHLASDLAIEKLQYSDGTLQFRVYNRGAMDISDVGVAVVIDNVYSTHRYLRLPWLSAGDSETFSLDIPLEPGHHQLEVIADPESDILQAQELQNNNKQRLALVVA